MAGQPCAHAGGLEALYQSRPSSRPPPPPLDLVPRPCVTSCISTAAGFHAAAARSESRGGGVPSRGVGEVLVAIWGGGRDSRRLVPPVAPHWRRRDSIRECDSLRTGFAQTPHARTPTPTTAYTLAHTHARSLTHARARTHARTRVRARTHTHTHAQVPYGYAEEFVRPMDLNNLSPWQARPPPPLQVQAPLCFRGCELATLEAVSSTLPAFKHDDPLSLERHNRQWPCAGPGHSGGGACRRPRSVPPSPLGGLLVQWVGSGQS